MQLKRQNLLIFIVLAGLLTVMVSPAGACWISLSAEEMFKQADIVIAGKIVGIEEEFQEGTGMASWMTSWRVEADYIFAGKSGSENQTDNHVFFVVTPGAANKGMMTSIDYRLNEGGDYVLLFLREREGRLEPLSPQGVMPLEALERSFTGKIKTGRDFLQAYRSVNGGQAEIESILKELSVTELLQTNSEQLAEREHYGIWSRIVSFFSRLFREKESA